MTQEHNTIVLGSTGAIGVLRVERFRGSADTQIVALAAQGNHIEELAYQAVDLEVFGVAVHEANAQRVHAAIDAANKRLGKQIRPEVLIGPDAAVQAATAGVDDVINAIRGIHGLRPSVAALETGANLKVANSETLLSKELLDGYLPADQPLSERVELLNPDLAGVQKTIHNHDVSRIVLTVRSNSRLANKRRTTIQRVKTMLGLNAGLAMLELRVISDVPVEIVEHDGPIAAIIELADGRSVFTPRRHLPTTWNGSTQWTFKETTIPVAQFVNAVIHEGGVYPLALHTAYNLAVHAHVEDVIAVEEIEAVVGSVMDGLNPPEQLNIQSVIEAEQQAEQLAMVAIEQLATK